MAQSERSYSMHSFSVMLNTEVIWPSSDEDIDGELLSDDAVDDDVEKMNDLGLMNGSCASGGGLASQIPKITCYADERQERNSKN